MSEHKKVEDYDLEPVLYCAKCYSLKIKYEESIDTECCMDCGCSDTQEASIEEWERLYEQRYGHKYTEKSNDIRKSPIFKLSLSKLKTKVFEHPKWKSIIQSLYPTLPKGIGKTDIVLWAFNKAIKDNRLDDLRISLIKHLRNQK